MLVGEMSAALREIVQDYKRYKIDELLGEAITLLSQRGRLDESVYVQRAQSIHERADKIIANNSIDRQPSDVKEKILESAYRDTLPSALAGMLKINVPVGQARGAPSEEVNQFRTQLQNTINSFLYFIYVSDGMKEVAPKPPQGNVIFKFVISDQSTDESARKVGRLLVYVDDFFQSVLTAANNDRPPPKLLAASTGSIDFSFFCDPATYAAIAHAYDALLKAAIESTRLLRAISFLRTNPLVTPGTMLGQDTADKAVETIIEQSFRTQVEALRGIKGDEIANGAMIKIKTTGTMLVEEMRRGSKFTFDLESVSSVSLGEINPPDEKTDLITAVKGLNQLQKALDAAVEEAKDLLQIEDHSGDDARDIIEA